jgi:S-adenosylhomocysteine hydrolase
MQNQIYTVPKEIDDQVALDALDSMNVQIDKLSAKQLKYRQSW